MPAHAFVVADETDSIRVPSATGECPPIKAQPQWFAAFGRALACIQNPLSRRFPEMQKCEETNFEVALRSVELDGHCVQETKWAVQHTVSPQYLFG